MCRPGNGTLEVPCFPLLSRRPIVGAVRKQRTAFGVANVDENGLGGVLCCSPIFAEDGRQRLPHGKTAIASKNRKMRGGRIRQDGIHCQQACFTQIPSGENCSRANIPRVIRMVKRQDGADGLGANEGNVKSIRQSDIVGIPALTGQKAFVLPARNGRADHSSEIVAWQIHAGRSFDGWDVAISASVWDARYNDKYEK